MTEELKQAAQQACHCQTCRPITMDDMRMVLCPTCGNKRCPHANNHRNACTNSNDPGQPGSAYPASALTQRPAAQAGEPTHPADCRGEWCKGKPAAHATPDVPETDFGNKATPEPAGGPREGEFFAFDAEGGHAFYKTQQEAIDHATLSLKYYRDGAADHNEWDEDVEQIRWGVVMQRANAANVETNDEGESHCDYELQNVATRPAPGVPEGWRDAKNDPPPVGLDVLVAVEFDRPGDWRIKVGGRNPQERTGWCVFGASWVPKVWMPLDAHRAALATAQAKGGDK